MSMCHNEAAHPNLASDDGYINWADTEQALQVVALTSERLGFGLEQDVCLPQRVAEFEQRDVFWCNSSCFAAWVAAKVLEDWANEPVYVRRMPEGPVLAHDFEPWPGQQ